MMRLRWCWRRYHWIRQVYNLVSFVHYILLHYPGALSIRLA
uniref:Uncharacterized protein n=1 Tax=Arundo donax TaxID=35708 RepID=A0A0A9GEL3_ARUDO